MATVTMEERAGSFGSASGSTALWSGMRSTLPSLEMSEGRVSAANENRLQEQCAKNCIAHKIWAYFALD